MKKSNLWLLAALTLPAALVLFTFKDALSPSNANADGSKPKAKSSLADAAHWQLPVSKEYTLKIGTKLTLISNATPLVVLFDPLLQGQAKIKTESKTDDIVAVTLINDTLTFEPDSHKEGIRATVTLPTSLMELNGICNAGDCRYGTSDTTAEIQSLNIRSDAAQSELRFGKLKVSNMLLNCDAGQLQVKIGTLATTKLGVDVNAGSFSGTINELQFSDLATAGSAAVSVSPGLYLNSGVGKTNLVINKAPAHSTKVRLNLGRLELRDGTNQLTLAGVNEERTFAGPDGAPPFNIKVDMGSAELTINNGAP